MTSYEDLISNFEKNMEPTMKLFNERIRSTFDQFSKTLDFLQPVIAYQSVLNESLQPVIRQLKDITILTNTEAFQTISEINSDFSSVITEKYPASNDELLDFDSIYTDLLNQIKYFEDVPLNNEQRDELLQNIDLVSNELADSSEISLDELNDVENEIAKSHDTCIYEQNDRESEQSQSYCEEKDSYFQIFLQGISSRLKDPDWQSEQAATNIMASFYVFVAALLKSVVADKLDPIVFIIILRLLLSLFPKH